MNRRGHPSLPKRQSPKSLFLLLTSCVILFASARISAQGRIDSPNARVLLDIPIEQLMEIEFVTVFKKPGSLMESPAAVFALNSDDIEVSGVTSLPDALRMVPGLQVAQHNANSWAVTSRGFSGMSRGISGQFANKLLVLSDGRSIYTPLFSGVSWEAQDFLLDDTERVEVVRGPGATLWGSNAVNGIINIVSKDARKTQGAFASVGGGSEQRAFSHLRYGGRLGDRTYYRVYGKYLKLDNLVNHDGDALNDGSNMFRGGFRFDSDLVYSHLTLQGELYSGRLNRSYNTIRSETGPFPQQFDYRDETRGGHLLARMQHSFSNSSELTVQAYYDRVETEEAVVRGNINTYDMEFSHRFDVGTRQEFIWGGGLRIVSDNFDSTFAFYLNPHSRTMKLGNAFLQDEIKILPRHVSLIIGSKFEHSDYSGFEIQPSARLRWTPVPTHTMWAAASKAVRTPSRGEIDARILLQENTANSAESSQFLAFVGSDTFKPERLTAWELGYRGWLSPNFMIDVATFYNDYDNLRTDNFVAGFDLVSLPGTPHSFLSLFPENEMRGTSYGFEFSADWQASRNWRFRTIYSHLQLNLDLINSFDTFTKSIEGQSPRHQMMLSSSWTPVDDVHSDLRLRYVSSLAAQEIPDYVTADVRIGWDLNRNLQLSLVGQNLLQSRHAESSEILRSMNQVEVTRTVASQIQRGVYSRLIWHF